MPKSWLMKLCCLVQRTQKDIREWIITQTAPISKFYFQNYTWWLLQIDFSLKQPSYKTMLPSQWPLWTLEWIQPYDIRSCTSVETTLYHPQHVQSRQPKKWISSQTYNTKRQSASSFIVLLHNYCKTHYSSYIF